MHVGTEHDASGGDGRQELLVTGLGRRLHGGARLRPEVLHDHLLHVAVPPVQVTDREQRLGPLTIRLADAHEDAGGERHRETTGVLDRAQAHGGNLVGRAEVRAALAAEAIARALEHEAHRGAHVLEPRDLLVGHDAGIQVRQQSRPLDDPDRDRAHVVEGGAVPPLLEPFAGDLVSILGSVAQG